MFDSYSLDAHVLDALERKGITTPTPIQVETLEHALAGRDVLGLARTGTGKTLAYALPIAQRVKPDSTPGRPPRALVVAPTRELALQVAGELAWVAPHLAVVAVYGGTGYGSQASSLRRGCDVVVATPGRAIDYLERGALDLGSVEIAVLDEADEMLSMGFEEDVERLLSAIPEEHQTLLFSATLPPWAKRLAEARLRDPVRVNVVSQEAVGYQELAVQAPPQRRRQILSDVLHVHGGNRAIVFARTKSETESLAQILTAKGNPAEAIHGDLNQAQRERAVERLRSGAAQVLVGTDVAARGLDIPEVDLVVHDRLPRDPEAYQHRSGRTGRAGRSGKVIIFYGPRERHALERLERAVRRRFERVAPPSEEEVRGARLQRLLQRIEDIGDDDRRPWRGVAESWLARQETDLLAGLLALALGGAEAPHSLLTGEEGWRTLKLEGRRLRVPQVVRMLMDAGASDLGRVELLDDGALVDVRPDEEERLADIDLPGLRMRAARPDDRGGRDGGHGSGDGQRQGRGDGSGRRTRKRAGDPNAKDTSAA